MEQRPRGVDVARMVAREQLERDQRRAAAGGALVVQPAAQQLQLLAELKLSDRAVRHRALAVVGAPGRRLELLVPLRAQLRELSLGAALGELLRVRRCLLERQTDASDRWAGPT